MLHERCKIVKCPVNVDLIIRFSNRKTTIAYNLFMSQKHRPHIECDRLLKISHFQILRKKKHTTSKNKISVEHLTRVARATSCFFVAAKQRLLPEG